MCVIILTLSLSHWRHFLVKFVKFTPKRVVTTPPSHHPSLTSVNNMLVLLWLIIRINSFLIRSSDKLLTLGLKRNLCTSLMIWVPQRLLKLVHHNSPSHFPTSRRKLKSRSRFWNVSNLHQHQPQKNKNALAIGAVKFPRWGLIIFRKTITQMEMLPSGLFFTTIDRLTSHLLLPYPNFNTSWSLLWIKVDLTILFRRARKQSPFMSYILAIHKQN